MGRRAVQDIRPMHCLVLVIASQKIARVVKYDWLSRGWPDRDEIESLIKTGDGDLPRRERIRSNPKYRKSWPVSIDGARTAIESCAMINQVTPRVGCALLYLARVLGDGLLEGSVLSSGLFAPGLSTGILTQLGVYTQLVAGRLRIEIGGTLPGVEHDVFVMPNRVTQGTALEGDIEGFGITFIEAGSCEKPVIAGRSGGAVEAVLDGETGLLVDPESVSEITEAIVKCLNDPETSQKLGRQARQRIQRELDWTILAKQVEKIL